MSFCRPRLVPSALAWFLVTGCAEQVSSRGAPRQLEDSENATSQRGVQTSSSGSETAAGAEISRPLGALKDSILVTAAWNGVKSLAPIAGASGQPRRPYVAVNRDGIAVVVWELSERRIVDGRQVIVNQVWTSRYSPGKDWSTPVAIDTTDGAEAYFPRVAVNSSGKATAAWMSFRVAPGNNVASIWAASTTASGQWAAAKRIDSGMTVYRNTPPAVSLDPAGNALIVWAEGFPVGEVWSNLSRPAGDWQGAALIAGDAKGAPVLATSERGDALVAWQGAMLHVTSHEPGKGFGAIRDIEQPVGTMALGIRENGDGMLVYGSGQGGGLRSLSFRKGDGWQSSAEIVTTDGIQDLAVGFGPKGHAVAIWTKPADGKPGDPVTVSEVSTSYESAKGWGTPVSTGTFVVPFGAAGVARAVAVDGKGQALAIANQAVSLDSSQVLTRRKLADGKWSPAEKLAEASAPNEEMRGVAIAATPSGQAVAAWIETVGSNVILKVTTNY